MLCDHLVCTEWSSVVTLNFDHLPHFSLWVKGFNVRTFSLPLVNCFSNYI